MVEQMMYSIMLFVETAKTSVLKLFVSNPFVYTVFNVVFRTMGQVGWHE